MEDNKIKIVCLWLLAMIGLCVHTSLDMMPLYWGKSVAVMTGEVPLSMELLQACFALTIPYCGVMLTIYGKKRSSVLVAYVLAVIVFLFHLAHMSELFMSFNAAQACVMPLNALSGALLIMELHRKQKTLK